MQKDEKTSQVVRRRNYSMSCLLFIYLIIQPQKIMTKQTPTVSVLVKLKKNNFLKKQLLIKTIKTAINFEAIKDKMNVGVVLVSISPEDKIITTLVATNLSY